MINVIKNNKLKLMLLYIYGFFIFYMPTIHIYTGISAQYVAIAIFGVNFIFNYKYLNKKILQKKLRWLLGGTILASIYYCFRALIAGNFEIDTNVLAIIQIVNIVILIKYLLALNYKSIDLIRFILNIGLIQSVIGILMFIIPSFRQVAFTLYLTGKPDHFSWITGYRIYGITSDYTYMTPLFHGMLGVVAGVYGVCINYKYLIYLPFLLFIIAVNGRTGILIMAVGLILSFAILFIKGIKVKKVLGYTIIILFSALLGMFILKIISTETYDWIISGIQDTVDLIKYNDKQGNYGALFGTMLYLPDGMGIIFGEGHPVFGGWARKFGYTYGSDIGFINDIFMGGIVYIVVLYTTNFKFLISSCKKSATSIIHQINKSISVTFVVLLLIANYKGDSMRASMLLLGMIFVKIAILYGIKEIDL